jgi:hypothetical protein
MLNQNFYSNEFNDKLFTISCNDKFGVENEMDNCGISLLNGTSYDIIQACTFIQTDLTFEITSQGIFIYDIPNPTLAALLKTHKITIDSYPSLVQFFGTYNLTENGIHVTGSFAFESKVYPSEFTSANIQYYLDPNWYMLIARTFLNIPLVMTISIIASAVFTCGCSLKYTYNTMCRPKRTYQHVCSTTARRARPRNVNNNNNIRLANNRNRNY